MKISLTSIPTTVATLSVLGFPLLAGFAQSLSIPSTELSIFMRGTVFFCSMILILQMRLPKITLVFKIFILSVVIFWIIYLQRILYYTLLDTTPTSYGLSHYMIWGLGTCLLPMLAIVVARKIASTERIFKAFLYICIFAMALSALQARTAFYVDNVLNDQGRLQLNSLNPISLGLLGSVGILLSVWLIIGKMHLGPRRLHIFLALVSSSLGSYLLIFSASRGPLVAILLVILFIPASTNRKAFIKMLFLITALFAPLIFIISNVNTDLFSSLVSRIDSLESGQDISMGIRLLSYAGAWNVFVDSPFLGSSMEEPITQFYPHNIFLEVLMSTGIVGFAPFVLTVILGLYFAFRLVRMNSAYAWVGTLYVLFLIQAQFSGSLYQSNAMWVLLALTAVLYFQEGRQPKADGLRGGHTSCAR